MFEKNNAENRLQPKHLWIVPDKYFSQPDGLASCACWNTHTTYGWKKSGFMIIIVTLLLYMSIFLPYIVAISRQAMPAFLPFISQAGGSPPMNGLFAFTLIHLAFIGFFTFTVFFESINQRNIHESKKITLLNKLAVLIIYVCCLGCIVTGANPIGYTSVPNKFEWIVTVLFEHGLGAIMILIGGVLFHFCLTPIWFLLPDAKKIDKYFKSALCIAFMLLFFTSAKPLPDHLYDELGPEPFNIPLLKNTTYELPLSFNTTYLICAICEWSVCLLLAVNFITLHKDFQRISVHVILRHKSCFTDSGESAYNISLKSIK